MIKLSRDDYWQSLKRHKKLVLTSVLTCAVISVASYFVLPKKYKVSTQVALQTQYFQLPLVSGFLPETLDPQELKSKREAILLLALNQKFLLEIGKRYHLLEETDGDALASSELDLLSKRFEIIPTGAAGFMINFVANDPNLAYQVLQEFISHLRGVMTQERHTLLLNLHDAIQDQLESISLGKQGNISNVAFSARPDLAQRRMEKIQNEIETLKASYSEKHPRISALQDQLLRLTEWNKPWVESNNAQPSVQRTDLFSDVKVEGSAKELFDDLIKKYRYLEVVIYMDRQNKEHYLSFLKEPYVPASPVWPKLPILLIWGMALGFLTGSVWALYRETPHPFKFQIVPKLEENLNHEPVQNL